MDIISVNKIRKSIFVIALPIIVQNLVQYIQIMVDTALLGRYKSIMLSALGNVVTPYFTMLSFLFAIGSGISILVSHAFGAKQYNKAARFSEVSFFYNSIISGVFFIIWFFGGHIILKLLGAKGEVLLFGIKYCRILSFSLIFFGIEMSIISTFQGIGVTKPIMYVSIIRNLVNAVLDVILIYGYWGFPEMGIEGAALATTVSNIIAASIYIIILFIGKKNIMNIKFGGILKPSWRVYKKIIIIGVPTGFEFMLFHFGRLLVTKMLNTIDSVSVGIYSLMFRIQIVGLFIYLGFAKANMTLVGQKIGEKASAQINKIVMLCTRYSMYVTIFFALLFFLFPNLVLSMFTNDKTIIERAIPTLYIVSIIIFPQTINMLIGHAIRGMKDTKWMMHTQFFGTIFVIVLSVFFIFSFKMGVIGIFIIYLMDELIRAFVNYFRFLKGREFFKFWKKNK